jgi:DNA-binding CsgD family transcriptional regulator
VLQRRQLVAAHAAKDSTPAAPQARDDACTAADAVPPPPRERMLDTLTSAPTLQPRSWPTAYGGPERRAARGALGTCLARMLDEVDYGMLLVGADAQVIFLNHAARQELDGHHPLQLMGRTLRAQRPQDVAPLFDALAGAQRGRRRLLALGEGDGRVSVSVVPLMAGADAGPRGDEPQPFALLMLGKRHVCEQLSVQGFASALKLTPAETRVLELLCAGISPTRIADMLNVAVCTVRTQIGSIRNKTGADGIASLVRQVARLPPLMSALRGGAAQGAR